MNDTIELYCQTLRLAYSIAKAERLAELRGRPHKRWDGAGLHPFSYAMGMLEAYRETEPLLRELDVTPMDLRAAAREDAALHFEEEVSLRHFLNMGWLTPRQADSLRVYTKET